VPFWKRESRNGLNKRIECRDRACPCPKRTMRKGFYQRKNPRLRGFDYSQSFAYFITICARDKQAVFCDKALNYEVINCLKREKENAGVRIFVYCLMPDHFHMLISPLNSGMNISRFIANFKGKTTRIGWKYGIRERMWQGRFYDHVLRPNEPVRDICEYILNNPVRGNLVGSWKDYKFGGFLDPIPV
jgi:putative transposase